MRVAAATVLVLALADVVRGQDIRGSADFAISDHDLNITFWGEAQFINAEGDAAEMGMSGSIGLFTEPDTLMAADFWSVNSGSWSGSSQSPGSYNTCYASSLAAQTWTISRNFYSGWACTGPPRRPPPPPTQIVTNPSCDPTCDSPILLNLAAGPYLLTDVQDGVSFDLDGDGDTEWTAWTSAVSRVAFLVRDVNGNGRIDDGRELFGNHTPLPDGSIAQNGYVALGPIDDNGDGVIDRADAGWQTLLLWIDRNHDGQSAPHELLTLESAGIRSLGLAYDWSGRRDRFGNLFRYRAPWTDVTGALHLSYDVYFTRQ